MCIETEDELTIRAGDEIRLLERVNDEWLKGSIADAVGIFPENCVEILVSGLIQLYIHFILTFKGIQLFCLSVCCLFVCLVYFIVSIVLHY